LDEANRISEVFDPRGRVDAERIMPAPRVAALDGLRLGILDKPNGTPAACCAKPQIGS